MRGHEQPKIWMGECTDIERGHRGEELSHVIKRGQVRLPAKSVRVYHRYGHQAVICVLFVLFE